MEERENVAISLKNVSKTYENNFKAVSDVSFDIDKGELVSIVGPHGSGKSTLLRLIAGVEDVTEGEIYLDGKEANGIPHKDRNVALAFQTASLYSSLNVYENLAYGLKALRLSKEEIDKRVRNAAKILQLTSVLDSKPKTLTAGQCQRVALGKIIVKQPHVYLMDEPLANLDRVLAAQIRSEIVKIHNDLGATMVVATSNQIYALTISSKLVVMNLGHVVQVGKPLEIYTKPANMFVASFFGSPTINLFKGSYENGVLTLLGGDKIELSQEFIAAHDNFYKAELMKHEAELESLKSKNFFNEARKVSSMIEKDKAALTEKHDIIYGIRPEDVAIGDQYSIRVVSFDLAGSNYYIHADFAGTDLVAKIPADNKIKIGDEIKIAFNSDKSHLFDVTSEKTIC